MDAHETRLVAEVRELARGAFAARAAERDRAGTFPHENMEDLRRLGLAGMALPHEIGGLDLSTEAQARIVEEIAYGDGSTALAFAMHRGGTDILANLPPLPRRDTVLKEVCVDGAFLCGVASIAAGEVDNRRSGFRVVEDGDALVVTGKAGFATMSDGARYAVLFGTLAPPHSGDGAGAEPDLVFALPRIDAPGLTVLRNWDAMGMRATASHDIVCDGLVVPRAEAYVVPTARFMALNQPAPDQDIVAFQRRRRTLLILQAVWLGLAQAAFDFTVAYVQQRHGYVAGEVAAFGGSAGYRADEPWAQATLGAMDHWLETGRMVLYEAIARLDTPFSTPAAFQRHLARTSYHLRRMTEEVGMGAMQLCGAHAYVRQRPLERIFRDMMGGVVMAMKTPQMAQALGRGALGLPMNLSAFA